MQPLCGGGTAAGWPWVVPLPGGEPQALPPLGHWERSFPSQETISFSFPLVCCIYPDMLEDLHPFPTSVSCSVRSSLMLLQKLYQQRRELGLRGGETWQAAELTAQMTVERRAGLGDAVTCSCSAAVEPWLSPFTSPCPSSPVLLQSI